MDRRALLRLSHLDIPLLCGVFAIIAVGLVALYSATDQNYHILIRQVLHLCIGAVVMLILAQIGPTQMARWVPWCYGMGVLLLVLVLFYGTGRGAERWIDLAFFRFQTLGTIKAFGANGIGGLPQ